MLVEGLVRDLDDVGVLRVERAQRNGAGQVPRRLGDPAVEVPRHAGLVGVAEEAEPLHPVGAQGRRHRPRLPGMPLDPALAAEVTLDRRGQSPGCMWT